MSEAYEIGVTLALSDGVSDGIGRARREIAALQRVLTTGGVSMAQLRRTATEANPPAKRRFEQRDADRTLASPPSATLPPTQQYGGGVMVEPRASPALSTDANVSKIGASAESNRAQWTDKRPDHLEAAQAVVQPSVAPQTASVPSANSLREAAQVSAPAVASGVVALEKSHHSRTIAPAPPNTVFPSQQGQSSAEISDIQPIASPKDRKPVVAQSSAGTLPGVKYSRTAGAAPPNYKQSKILDESVAFFRPLVATPTAPQAVGNQEWSGGPEQAAQPRLVAPTMPSDSRMGQKGRPDSTGVDSPPSAAGPVEGDVYLDGMLVGRWMSRFLAQEAGRASVGPTGFDGRRGWLLPGATVGT